MFEQPLVFVQFSILVLLLVAVASEITFRRLHFPYVIGLLLVGFFLGIILPADNYQAWLDNEEDVIFYIFLPILVFESALNLDSRLLFRNLVPVLTLAIPGVVISTLIVGGLAGWLTPLGWAEAFLFGGLVAATDPVAVIALFKELGAPQRLTILVEGESLFNDASAIVLFEFILHTFFLHAGEGGSGLSTAFSGGLEFLWVFLGGIILGFMLGLVVVWLIPLEQDNATVQVVISVVMAYLAYIGAEQIVGVSGVMAVVGLGLMVSWFGSIRYTPEARADVRQFWEFASFLANSLIFLLVGLTQASFFEEISLTGEIWQNLPFMAIAIGAVLLARALVIATLMPLLNRIWGGEGVGWRFQTILFWGGLRGAVALGLALSLTTALGPEFQAANQLIMSMTLAVVLFTILVSGTTMDQLMHRLGLDRRSVIDQLGLASTWLAAKREALSRITRMTRFAHFSARLGDKLKRQYRHEINTLEQECETLSEAAAKQGQLSQLLWLQIINVEAKAYSDFYQRGSLSEVVERELEYTIATKRDAVRAGQIPPPMTLAEPVDLHLIALIGNAISRLAPHSALAQQFYLNQLEVEYECNVAIAEAAELVLKEIQTQTLMLDAADLSGIQCRQAYQTFSKTALARLDELALDNPDHVLLLQQRNALAAALEGEVDAVERLISVGDVLPGIASEVKHHLAQHQYQLMRQPIVRFSRNAEGLLKRVPAFSYLAEADLRTLADQLESLTLLAGETLLKAPAENIYLYLIAEGILAIQELETEAVSLERHSTLHSGEYFGESDLFMSKASAVSLIAATDCRLYRLARSTFTPLRSIYRASEEAWSAHQKYRLPT